MVPKLPGNCAQNVGSIAMSLRNATMPRSASVAITSATCPSSASRLCNCGVMFAKPGAPQRRRPWLTLIRRAVTAPHPQPNASGAAPDSSAQRLRRLKLCRSASAFVGLSGIESWLTGPVGTDIAVIAVASFGFSLLGGRLSLRRGGLVVLGSFVLFGAPSIARGLLGLAGETHGPTAVSGPATIDVPPPAVPTPPAYDPYAGAAMPSGQ